MLSCHKELNGRKAVGIHEVTKEQYSRLLEFGRYAEERRKRRGEGKTETFDFLGFTFYCGENQAGKSG
ncbi:hypothetical protein [Blautia pseudococcoides]|uniref:hypothetical protein n=1 Tax=Blautia pseudococcoides TaxID=1796616 RepID=UPI00080C404E|nr:hypothetical protein [Blautia pseudococcoides]ASU30623.1 hypothetical protein ADH70_018610 [Blautia pseudococcoides]QQQ91147.1 hypothetical protein I5Q86_12345 [Blautia pseudococcoides]